MNREKDSFILKHWAKAHPESETPPIIEFRVIKNHRDCMSRLLREAVLIEDRVGLIVRMNGGATNDQS